VVLGSILILPLARIFITAVLNSFSLRAGKMLWFLVTPPHPRPVPTPRFPQNPSNKNSSLPFLRPHFATSPQPIAITGRGIVNHQSYFRVLSPQPPVLPLPRGCFHGKISPSPPVLPFPRNSHHRSNPLPSAEAFLFLLLLNCRTLSPPPCPMTGKTFPPTASRPLVHLNISTPYHPECFASGFWHASLLRTRQKHK